MVRVTVRFMVSFRLKGLVWGGKDTVRAKAGVRFGVRDRDRDGISIRVKVRVEFWVRARAVCPFCIDLATLV